MLAMAVGFFVMADLLPQAYLGFMITAVVLAPVGVLMFVIAIAMSRRRAPLALLRLRAAGVPGQAQIVGLRQTNMYVNYQPVVELQLQVTTAMHAPYTVTRRETVPQIMTGLLTSGRPLPAVMVDPARPDNLAVILWESAMSFPAVAEAQPAGFGAPPSPWAAGMSPAGIALLFATIGLVARGRRKCRRTDSSRRASAMLGIPHVGDFNRRGSTCPACVLDRCFARSCGARLARGIPAVVLVRTPGSMRTDDRSRARVQHSRPSVASRHRRTASRTLWGSRDGAVCGMLCRGARKRWSLWSLVRRDEWNGGLMAWRCRADRGECSCRRIVELPALDHALDIRARRRDRRRGHCRLDRSCFR